MKKKLIRRINSDSTIVVYVDKEQQQFEEDVLVLQKQLVEVNAEKIDTLNITHGDFNRVSWNTSIEKVVEELVPGKPLERKLAKIIVNVQLKKLYGTHEASIAGAARVINYLPVDTININGNIVIKDTLSLYEETTLKSKYVVNTHMVLGYTPVGEGLELSVFDNICRCYLYRLFGNCDINKTLSNGTVRSEHISQEICFNKLLKEDTGKVIHGKSLNDAAIAVIEEQCRKVGKRNLVDINDKEYGYFGNPEHWIEWYTTDAPIIKLHINGTYSRKRYKSSKIKQENYIIKDNYGAEYATTVATNVNGIRYHTHGNYITLADKTYITGLYTRTESYTYDNTYVQAPVVMYNIHGNNVFARHLAGTVNVNKHELGDIDKFMLSITGEVGVGEHSTGANYIDYRIALEGDSQSTYVYRETITPADIQFNYNQIFNYKDMEKVIKYANDDNYNGVLSFEYTSTGRFFTDSNRSEKTSVENVIDMKEYVIKHSLETTDGVSLSDSNVETLLEAVKYLDAKGIDHIYINVMPEASDKCFYIPAGIKSCNTVKELQLLPHQKWVDREDGSSERTETIVRFKREQKALENNFIYRHTKLYSRRYISNKVKFVQIVRDNADNVRHVYFEKASTREDAYYDERYFKVTVKPATPYTGEKENPFVDKGVGKPAPKVSEYDTNKSYLEKLKK